jgi:hypothetical protein
MPELKKGSTANALSEFVASALDPDSVRFKDKTREKQRQQVGGWVNLNGRMNKLEGEDEMQCTAACQS